MSDWLAVVIGNSRLHWALFKGSELLVTWDSSHLTKSIDWATLRDLIPGEFKQRFGEKPLEVVLASVVPPQTVHWHDYPQLKLITLSDIPLQNLYPTMGIDRALAIYGAGESYGYPCLVVDGGTALTFTAVASNKGLIGGAILSGLRSQVRGLAEQTAALPKIDLPLQLPSRWATQTPEAIASGIIYTLTAGISDYLAHWQREYPQSPIIFTGGDGETYQHYLQQIYPEIDYKIICDRNLIFKGLQFLQT